MMMTKGVVAPPEVLHLRKRARKEARKRVETVVPHRAQKVNRMTRVELVAVLVAVEARQRVKARKMTPRQKMTLMKF